MAQKMLQLFTLLAVIALHTCCASYADEDYKYALALMKERKEYKSAAEKFNNFVQTNPDSNDAPKALFYMASCLARLGKDNSAGSAYEKIIMLYQNAEPSLIINSYAYGADAYFRAKLFKKAGKLYEKLINAYPDSKPVESSIYWLAECYNRLAVSSEHNIANSNYQKAIKTYLDFQKKYPVSKFLPDALTSAGILAYNFKDYQQSSFFFSLFDDIDFELEADKQELITYYAGESLYWLKDYKAAAKRFKSIVKNYPSGKFIAESYAGLGWCYYSLQETLAAAEAFKNAAINYKNTNDALNSHFDAAAAFEEAGNTADAIKEYRIVINSESHPKKQAALVRLGVLQKDSSSSESSELLSQAFDPNNKQADKSLSIEAGILLAEKSFDNKEYAKAASIFQKIVKLAPNSKYAPYALYQLALARSKQKEYKKASTAIKLLLKNYPDTPLRLQAAYAIADYQDILGDTKKSEIAYKWLAQESEKWATEFLSSHQVDNPKKFAQDAKDIAAASLLRLAEALFKIKNSPEAQTKAKDFFSDYINRYPNNPRLAAALLRLGELTEADNLQIAHTYFKNAISSAANFTNSNSKDIEYSNIIMHAKYRLCLNNILLSQKAEPASEKHKQYLNSALENINNFFIDYKNNNEANNLLSQLQFYKSEAEYSLGNVDAALKGYEQSYQINKDSNIADAALFSSAWIDQEKGDTASAAKKLKTLLTNYKDSTYCCNALYILAVYSKNNKELTTAEDYLKQLLNNYPKSDLKSKAQIELAKISSLQGKYDTAINNLKELLKNKDLPEYPDAIYTLSRVYWSTLSSKDNNSKSEVYTNITKILVELLNKYPNYENNILAKFRLGEVAYNQKAYENAINWYKKVLSASDDKLADKTHYRLAWCYLKLANKEEAYSKNALNEFLAICNSYPTSNLFSESALRAGKLLRQNKDYSRALKLYKQAESKSNNTDIVMGARYGQGITLLQLEEYSKALRIFKNYLSSYPKSPLIHEANWGAGQAALMLGASEDAKDYFNLAKADKYNGEAAAKARFGLGIIAMEKNEFKLAREEFRKVDVFHSQWRDVAAAALLKAVEASRELGEAKPAENDLKRIIDIYANTPSAHTAEELLLSEADK